MKALFGDLSVTSRQMGQKFVKVKNIDPIKGSTRGQKYYMSDQPCLPSTEPRCGTANRMERIVGGQNTSTKRWPWIVYLTIFRFAFQLYSTVKI